MPLSEDVLAPLRETYRRALTQLLIAGTIRAAAILLSGTTATFLVTNGQRFWVDMLSLKFWILLAVQLALLMVYFLYSLKRTFGTRWHPSRLMHAIDTHRIGRRRLLPVDDIIVHGMSVMVFMVSNSIIYAAIYDRSSLQIVVNGALNARTVLWIAGSIGAASVLSLKQGCRSAHRVNFMSEQVAREHLRSFDTVAFIRDLLMVHVVGFMALGWILILAMHLGTGSLGSRPAMPFRLTSLSALCAPMLWVRSLQSLALSMLMTRSIDSLIASLIVGRNLRTTRLFSPSHQSHKAVLFTPMAILLGGLTDRGTFAQEAALFELYEMVMFEADRRKRFLFNEALLDTMVIKELVSFLVFEIKAATRGVEQDIQMLRDLEHSMGSMETPRRTTSENIPAVLRTSKLSSPPQLCSSQASLAHLLARYPMGRLLLYLVINGHVRVRHLPKWQLTEYLLVTLSAISVAAYDEDSHGQVQLLLTDILQALIAFRNAVAILNGPVEGLRGCPPCLILSSLQRICDNNLRAIHERFPAELMRSLHVSNVVLKDLAEIIKQ